MSSNNKKDPPMEPFHPGDKQTTDTTRTGTSSSSNDKKDGNGRPKEDLDNEPSTAPADSVTGVTTATSSNSPHDRAIRKPRHHAKRKVDPELNNGTTTATTSTRMEENATPGHRETREQDIEENLYMDSSSDDDSLTPGAVHVGGVLNTLDSTRTFSESSIVDRPQQPVAVPSVLHLVAELVPETDDVQAEVERLREELQLEREERENPVVVIASSAEPMVEGTNFTKRKTMIYCGIAAFFVVIGVVVGWIPHPTTIR
jgi:hypothetical protein